MRRQVSATGVFTFFLAAGAGILLTAKLHLTATEDLLSIPLWILWLAEALAYLAALLIWTPNISRSFLVLGIAGILLLRASIAAGAAAVGLLIQPDLEIETTFLECLTEPLPRACSVIFALMASYPLRVLFPHRISGGTQKIQSREQTSPEAAVGSPAGTFLFGAPQGRHVEKDASADAASAQPAPEPAPPLPDHLRKVEIDVPFKVVFPQLPAGVLRSDIAERAFQDSQEMQIRIPLNIIAPQLKEALIQISVAALLSFLPKGWAETPMSGAEEMIDLPLEVVIPQLPEEVLQLQPTSPPDWAQAAADQESILFARV
ncbi:MAG: hypothetical protein GTN69_03015 [Armatimonadetes bacterium]|nr:hypothetical protein [Armatimonadota bacterium]NIO74869.1 hypothetical protein [Armatimonadota bacterium]NIO95631.1 hypothetical protein [Armatimonadota bacterium]